jgi:hypothetical protein
MTRFIRALLYMVSFIQLALAIAFIFQVPQITGMWPFPGTTPLTFIFVASIFAAAAASTVWALATRTDGALVGIGIDYLLILLPVSLLCWQLGASSGALNMTVYAVICFLGALFGVWLIIKAARIPIPPQPPAPALVRASFVVFIIALLYVSIQLILKVPEVLPWMITPELSVLIGWMFIGAAGYFIYAVLRPSWGNAGGQLAGFLAYDLVLIVPFLQRLPAVAPNFRTNLIIYIVVVTYSGLLAFYFLFIHKTTRFSARKVDPSALEIARQAG